MSHETLCAHWTDAEHSAEMHIYLSQQALDIFTALKTCAGNSR
jgi:hypothetical protein